MEEFEVIHSKVTKYNKKYKIGIYLRGKLFNATIEAWDDVNVADVLANSLRDIDIWHDSLRQAEIDGKKEIERDEHSKIAYA